MQNLNNPTVTKSPELLRCRLEKSVLASWYVTGLVDAEGSFSVSVSKSTSRSLGYAINVSFELALQASDKHILVKLKDYFGVGGIYNHGSDMYRYKVSSIGDLLKIIIPHFERFPLLTDKGADFLLFKDIVTLLGKGVFNKDGLQKIINYKAVLNRGLSERLKSAFPDTIPSTRSKITFKGIPDSE